MNQQYMNASRECEELRALIPAYSLNLTDPDETRFVETTLANCPEVAAELEDYRQLAEALLDTPRQVAAPPHIAYRLIEQASATKPSLSPSVQPQRIIPVSRRKNWLTAAVGLAAAVGLIFAMGVFFREIQSRDALSDKVALQQELIALLSSGNFVDFPLTAEDDPTSAAMGRILCHPDQTIAMLRVENFPPPPPGRAYQLWLRTDDQRISGGVFHPAADGSALVVFEAPVPLSEFRYAGITLEPASGSSEPTTPAVIRGSLY